MGNVLAIARRELRSYFASPIAYIVIGFYALIFGWFFFQILNFFVQQSVQSGQFGMTPSGINVNQMMIRPVLLNTSVIFLFVLPMITMRTFAEEKRSGTMELLLTTPLTDWQIVLGKFLGAMGLFSVMLAFTLIHMGLLFIYGDPDWKPIVTGYLGLLLLGGSFIAVGLFISSLTRNQIIAAAVTFATFLMLWVINWAGEVTNPLLRTVVTFLSITDHFEDFTKGVIDTKHLAFYLSFITFGLFLTAKSVDSERWRG